jgi:hypothetical protein
MSEQEKAPEIVFDLRRLTLADYAALDEWAFGRAPFADALPVMQKAVANGVELGGLGLPMLRPVVQQIKAAVRDLPGN